VDCPTIVCLAGVSATLAPKSSPPAAPIILKCATYIGLSFLALGLPLIPGRSGKQVLYGEAQGVGGSDLNRSLLQSGPGTRSWYEPRKRKGPLQQQKTRSL
jgi:hypothetical protein